MTAGIDLGVGRNGSGGLAREGTHLAQEAQVVADGPVLDALAVLEADEVDLAVGEGPVGGGQAHEWPGVAGGADRARVPVEQRPAIAAVIAETDPHRQLELYAATQPGIHARAGPLLRVLIGAAATDPELAELWTQIEKERLSGMGRFARLLADRGVLRPGLSAEEARDLLWTLNSLAVHDLLVRQRGWSPERYRDWLAAALARELLHG
jgi:hypothetical protein